MYIQLLRIFSCFHGQNKYNWVKIVFIVLGAILPILTILQKWKYFWGIMEKYSHSLNFGENLLCQNFLKGTQHWYGYKDTSKCIFSSAQESDAFWPDALKKNSPGRFLLTSTKTFTENWVSKQSFFVLILTTV